jgi:hypothetical protein
MALTDQQICLVGSVKFSFPASIINYRGGTSKLLYIRPSTFLFSILESLTYLKWYFSAMKLWKCQFDSISFRCDFFSIYNLKTLQFLKMFIVLPIWVVWFTCDMFQGLASSFLSCTKLQMSSISDTLT